MFWNSHSLAVWKYNFTFSITELSFGAPIFSDVENFLILPLKSNMVSSGLNSNK